MHTLYMMYEFNKIGFKLNSPNVINTYRTLSIDTSAYRQIYLLTI